MLHMRYCSTSIIILYQESELVCVTRLLVPFEQHKSGTREWEERYSPSEVVVLPLPKQPPRPLSSS